MVIKRYYNDDGSPRHLITYQVAADGTLEARRLIYPASHDFKRLWDKGSDVDLGGA